MRRVPVEVGAASLRALLWVHFAVPPAHVLAAPVGVGRVTLVSVEAVPASIINLEDPAHTRCGEAAIRGSASGAETIAATTLCTAPGNGGVEWIQILAIHGCSVLCLCPP